MADWADELPDARLGMSNENWIIWLRALLAKVDLTLAMISIHEPLDEVRSMIISQIRDLGGDITAASVPCVPERWHR